MKEHLALARPAGQTAWRGARSDIEGVGAEAVCAMVARVRSAEGWRSSSGLRSAYRPNQGSQLAAPPIAPPERSYASPRLFQRNPEVTCAFRGVCPQLPSPWRDGRFWSKYSRFPFTGQYARCADCAAEGGCAGFHSCRSRAWGRGGNAGNGRSPDRAAWKSASSSLQASQGEMNSE